MTQKHCDKPFISVL